MDTFGIVTGGELGEYVDALSIGNIFLLYNLGFQ
jgi:hypothetical protein